MERPFTKVDRQVFICLVFDVILSINFEKLSVDSSTTSHVTRRFADDLRAVERSKTQDAK